MRRKIETIIEKNVEKLLHQSEYCPKRAPVKSHASESYLCDTEVCTISFDGSANIWNNPEVKLSVRDT